MARPHPALMALAAGRGIGADLGPDVLRSAREHRMTGVLFTALAERDETERPPWWPELVLLDLGVRGDHERMWASLRVVNERLGRIGVDFAVAKGVAAERRWYARPGERPCADIDIVLAPQDAPRLPEVLSTLQPGHPLRDPAARLAARGLLQSVEARIDGDGDQVDVHTDLLKTGVPTSFGRDSWSRLQTLSLGEGGSVKVLDPEAQLVHFAVHLNKGRFPHLLGLVDVVRLISREHIDWTSVRRLSERCGVPDHVRLTIDTVYSELSLRSPVPGLPPSGWRAATWHGLWRPSTRLLGADVTSRRYPRRDYLITLTQRRSRTMAARYFVHRALRPADRRAMNAVSRRQTAVAGAPERGTGDSTR